MPCEKGHLEGKKTREVIFTQVGRMGSSSTAGSELSAGPEVTAFRSDFVKSILIGAACLVPRLEMFLHPSLSFSLESKTLWSSISFLFISRFPKEQKQGLNDEQSLKCH